MTSIMIPDSVTSIGSYAFRGCTGLTLLEIGSGVTTIGNDAFYGCRELITVTIPEGVTNISSSAFSACYRLVEVYNKSSLSITVGETSNGAVGYYAKNVYTIEGGSKLFTTEDGYLLYTSETEVSLIAYYGSEYALIIPPSVTEINQYAFYNNNNLTSVIIPDSVKSIGESSFQSCRGLISVTIGRNVVSIGRYAFDYCYRLVEVYNKSSLSITKGGWDYGDVGYYAKNVYNIEGGSKLSTTEDGFILYLEGNDISLMGYIGSERDLMLPATLTSIYQYAFHYCTELSSVMISDGVTSIDSYAFFGCTSLSSITIPNSVNSIGSHVFQNCMGLTSIYYQGTRSQWEAINKGSDWDNNTGKYTVYFMDEVVTE